MILNKKVLVGFILAKIILCNTKPTSIIPLSIISYICNEIIVIIIFEK